MKTEDAAKLEWVCPIKAGKCIGTDCAAWRWEKITTLHPLWKPAVLARAQETGDKVPYAKASAWVAENKAALGMVPVLGYCGLGGQP